MPQPITFTTTLRSARGGGHVVAVDPSLAATIGAKQRSRVRGQVQGVSYRSNLASMGGELVLGVHKAVVEAAGVVPGDRVRVTMELDTEPLPSDTVPPDLRSALAGSTAASAAWERTSPSRRRRYVQGITEAKRPETRRRRIEACLQELAGGPGVKA
jgi:hypothetical protein